MNTVGKTNVRMCVCVHSTVTSPGVGAPSMVWFQAYIHHSYTTHTQTSTNGVSKYVNEAQFGASKYVNEAQLYRNLYRKDLKLSGMDRVKDYMGDKFSGVVGGGRRSP